MNCRSAKLPSLHHSKEGWMRHKSNVAKPPLLAQTVWFSLRVSIGKPPRPRAQRTLRDIFLIARPPLLAVMQGGDFCTPRFIHNSAERPTAALPEQLRPGVQRFNVDRFYARKQRRRQLRIRTRIIAHVTLNVEPDPPKVGLGLLDKFCN